MPDSYDRHNKFSALNIINDSIITDANSVCMVRSHELLATWRNWIIRKTINR